MTMKWCYFGLILEVITCFSYNKSYFYQHLNLFLHYDRDVAQSSRHWTSNPGTLGSIPAADSNILGQDMNLVIFSPPQGVKLVLAGDRSEDVITTKLTFIKFIQGCGVGGKRGEGNKGQENEETKLDGTLLCWELRYIVKCCR